ncbi:MAG: dephospho-CoA kinase [Rhodoferax sp.]
MTARSLRLGISGGIGSGKSTICQLLARFGATVIDLDALSRASTAAGGPAIGAVRSTFGQEFIDSAGAMDRIRMRDLVFSDKEARARLEAIVHPLIAEESTRLAENAQKMGVRCIVFDIPLLVESSHWRTRLDRILMVDCTVDTQIQRVQARSGLSEVEIHNILRAQSTRGQRLQAADAVIFNDGKNLLEVERELRVLGPQFGL